MSLTNPHILLVTEDPMLQDFVTTLSQKEGFDLDIARNRLEATDQLQKTETPFNIVLIHYSEPASAHSPCEPGVANLRSATSGEIIFITNGDRAQGVAALKEGAFDYLDKSVVEEELLFRIVQVIRFQRLLSIEREDSLFKTLGQVRRALALGKTEEELLDIGMAGLREFGFDRVRLYFISDDGRLLRAIAHSGMEDDFLGRAASLKQCHYMLQFRKDPRPRVFRRVHDTAMPFEDLLGKEDVIEWAGVPLILNGRVVGKISVDNKLTKRRIFEDDLNLLFPFALEVVEAVANARESRKMELLQVAIKSITGLEDGEQLLNTITWEAMKLLQTRTCGVYVYYPERKDLLLVTDFRHPEFIGKKRLRLGEGLAGWLVESGQPYEIIPRYSEYERKANIFEVEDFGAGIGVLLTAQKKTVGVLYVEDALPRQFTKQDARLLCLFSERAAAELAQWEQKARLQTLLDCCPLGIVAASRPRGIVTSINKAAARILKHDVLDVKERLTVFDLYASAKEPFKIRQLLDEGNRSVLNYETTVKAKDGETIPILHSSTWLHDSAGERIGSVGFFEDLRAIKERERRFEIVLRASNLIAKAKDIKEGLNDLAQMMVSLVGGTFCRILLIDEAASTLVPMGAFRLGGNDMDCWSPAASGPTRISEWPQLREILRDGRPVVRKYTDTDIRPDLMKLAGRLGLKHPIQSLLLVPLNVGERAIGLLHVGEEREESGTIFGVPEIEMAGAVAAQTALLVDRERSRLRLEALFKASTALVSADDPEQVFLDVVERAREAAGASSVSLVQIDEHARAINHVTAGIEAFPDIASIIRPDGITMHVWKEGEPVVIEDTAAPGSNFNPKMLEAAEIGAAVCLPVKLRGSPSGVMWVHYREPRPFRNDEIETLQLYVNQTALAYDNSRRISELKRIREAAKALASATTQEDVLKEIVVSACKALVADSAVIWFYDGRNFVPESSHSYGIPEDLWEQFRLKGPRQHGTAHKVMERGILEIADVKDSDELGEATQGLLTKIGARRFLGVALRGDSGVGRQTGLRHEVLGVLYVNYKQPRSFRLEERELILSFANQAAFALKKALLLVQMGGLLGQVETARKTAQRVAEVTTQGDLNSTLDAVTKGTRDALACDAVSIYVYYPEDNRLSSPSIVGAFEPEKADLLKTVPPHSIVFEVLNSNDIIAVEDISKSDLFKSRPFAAREGMRSCAATPLRIGSELVGVMFVNYRTPHVFSEYEIANIRLFSSQAAIAIHNTRLLGQTKKDLEDREDLLELSSQLLGTLSLHETMMCAVTFAAKAFDVEFCSLVLPFDERRLRFECGFGWPKEMEGNSYLGSGYKSQSGYTIQTRQPICVYDFKVETRFSQPDIVSEYNLKSALSVPIWVDHQTTGAMLLHTTKKRRFGNAEVNLLQLIANQTGIAIRSARHYEATEKARLQIEALYEASKASTTATGGAERGKILEEIMRQAVEYLQPQAVLGTLHTFESETGELTLVTAYPTEHFNHLVTKLGERRPLRGNERTGFKMGVIGKAVLTGETQMASSEDLDYVELHADVRSELAVPLREHDKVIGVLNIESNKPGAFDVGDQKAIEALAELALMVINIARQYKVVAARTALAFMGLSSNLWYHSVRTRAIQIRDNIEIIKRQVDRPSAAISNQLRYIDDAAKRIIDFPRLHALSSQEGVYPVPINDHLVEQLRWLKEHGQLGQCDYEFMLSLSNGVSVTANPTWLRQVWEVLVDNAAEAMSRSTTKLLTIGTVREGPNVLIEFSDTGCGIPEEIRWKVLEEPIAKANEMEARGWGLGLLMARFVVQVYGGDISMGSTGPGGTTMIVRLPIVRE